MKRKTAYSRKFFHIRWNFESASVAYHEVRLAEIGTNFIEFNVIFGRFYVNEELKINKYELK